MIIHQSEIFIEYLTYGLLEDWNAHTTPSGNMEHDDWLNATIYLRTTLVATVWKSQVVFVDDHEYHYNVDSFDITESNFIQPFILKPGNRKIISQMITSLMLLPKRFTTRK